jgi:NOL1/NOP2/fmu family ribosome biogenesis protein
MNLNYTSAATLGLELDDHVLASHGIRVVDPAPVISHLVERFAFPADTFESLVILQASTKVLRVASPPLDLTAHPAIDRVGIDFLRIDMANPRMTTSAVMTWGSKARQNVVDTDVDQCTAFLRRRPIVLNQDQINRCTARGFVIIRHDGHGLGSGFLESTRHDDHNFGRVRSMYPSAYSADLEQTSPFGNPS